MWPQALPIKDEYDMGDGSVNWNEGKAVPRGVHFLSQMDFAVQTHQCTSIMITKESLKEYRLCNHFLCKDNDE